MVAFVVAVLAAVFGVFAAGSASAVLATYTYDAAVYAYDAPARFSSPDTAATHLRGSPSWSEVASAGTLVVAGACCTAANTGDDLVNLASPTRTSHILDGEVRPNGTFGGGHRAGTGFPKSRSSLPRGQMRRPCTTSPMWRPTHPSSGARERSQVTSG